MYGLNLPNFLTLLRILLVPVVVVALLDETDNGDLLAAIVFGLASATDGIDGWLARSRNSVTGFGKLMDPIADKLLIIAALLALVSLDKLAAWVAMVIIARDVAITGARLAASQEGVDVAAKAWGKVKTAAQVAMVMSLIVWGPTTAVDALVYATVAITILSGADYLLGLRRRMGEARRARAGAQPEPAP